MVIDRQTQCASALHVQIRPARFSRNAQHGVAALQESMRHGVLIGLEDRVTWVGPASAVNDRQRQPFADHWQVSTLVDRQRVAFETVTIACNLRGIAARTRGVGATNQDQHGGARSHGDNRTSSCTIVQYRAEVVDPGKSVLTAQRKRQILARLSRDGQVIAKDLAQEWHTSEDSIRRDLRELARAGKLQRVHGGALPASLADGSLQIRESVSVREKVALGKAGAAMIRPGQVVILDGGTTALQIARHLAPDLRATLVTHSPTVAVELAAHPHIEIVILGGRLFRHSMVTVGATLIDAASRLRADLYFMGVTGVHPTAGLSTGDAEEAAVKRALHGRAAETIVLASSEKLLAASAFVVVPIGDVSAIVVPPKTERRTVDMLKKSGVT